MCGAHARCGVVRARSTVKRRCRGPLRRATRWCGCCWSAAPSWMPKTRCAVPSCRAAWAGVRPSTAATLLLWPPSPLLGAALRALWRLAVVARCAPAAPIGARGGACGTCGMRFALLLRQTALRALLRRRSPRLLTRLIILARSMATRRCTMPHPTASWSARGCCWSAARTRRPKKTCAPRRLSLLRRAASERGAFGASLVAAFVRRIAAPFQPPPRAPLGCRALGPLFGARCARAACRGARRACFAHSVGCAAASPDRRAPRLLRGLSAMRRCARLSGAEAWRCHSLCAIARSMATRRCTRLRSTATWSARGCCWSAARTRMRKTRCALPLRPLRLRRSIAALARTITHGG